MGRITGNWIAADHKLTLDFRHLHVTLSIRSWNNYDVEVMDEDGSTCHYGFEKFKHAVTFSQDKVVKCAELEDVDREYDEFKRQIAEPSRSR